MLKDYATKRIGIIDQLEKSATPSELLFYRKAKEEFESYLDFPNPPSEVDLSVPQLRRKLDKLHRIKSEFEFELADETRGLYWHDWLKFELEIISKNIDELGDRLKQQGEIYTAPVFNIQEFHIDQETLQDENRIEEIVNLINLITIWEEKNGTSLKSTERIEHLQIELNSLKIKLNKHD
ncbi:hypothetical protein Dxin01_03906 [Deinococcus xinjiangensis]|uniref:Uncharacterized protein n=1 Tax=Deinococcus xinjiangensis TaxID=457454 RepID=A0ABP9VFY7_9DEIO